MHMVGSNLSVQDDFSLATPEQAPVAVDRLSAVIWRQRWIVTTTVIVFLCAGMAYFLLAKRYYTSVGRVSIEAGRNDNADMNRFGLFTELEVMSSTPILVRAISDPRVQNAVVFNKVTNRLVYLKKELKVEAGKRDNILTVSFAAPDPREAQAMVDSVLDSYHSYREQHTRSKADIDLGEDRLVQKEYDQKIKGLMEKMVEFRSANHTIDLTGNFGNITREKLNSLSAGLAIAQRETVDAKADYDEAAKSIGSDPEKLKQLEAMVETSIPSSQEAILTIKKELAQMDQQVQELERQHFLPAHPQIVGLMRKIDELNLRFASVAKKRWEASQWKEAALRMPYEEEHKKAEELELKASQYAIMEDGLRRLRNESDLLQTRAMHTTVNRDQGAHNIDIFETASYPDKHSWPHGSIIMAVSLVLGSLSGIGLARVREWVSPKLQSLDEVRNTLGLPILACIPHWDEDGADTISAVGDAADEFAELRSAVIAASNGRDAKTVLLTAPSHSHGVSVVIHNLARSMATAGDRVLVIDANFRSPRQHLLLNLPADTGLSTVLNGECKIQDAIQETGVRGLEFLSCGRLPQRPTDLLKSTAFEDLMRELGSQYDSVLLDSPPVNQAADARIAAASCDATILVIRARKGDRRQSGQAYDALTSTGAHLVGVVINDVPRRGSWHNGGLYTGSRRQLPASRRGLPLEAGQLS